MISNDETSRSFSLFAMRFVESIAHLPMLPIPYLYDYQLPLNGQGKQEPLGLSEDDSSQETTSRPFWPP